MTRYGLRGVLMLKPETADAPAKAVSSKEVKRIAVTSDYARLWTSIVKKEECGC